VLRRHRLLRNQRWRFLQGEWAT
ncbi:MAG: hypothetical protein AVDCRST_MAG75-1702, partial [uncultured Propionibacteriaceae bacterium]